MAPCTEHHRAYRRRRRDEARARGDCLTCTLLPARPNKATCVDCSQAQTRAARRRILKRQRAGLCTTCGLKPATQGRVCKGCDERTKAFPSHGKPDPSRVRKAKAGQCFTPGCEGTALDHRHCKACRVEQSKRKLAVFAERIAQGLCRCGKTKVRVPGESCSACKKRRRQLTRAAKHDVTHPKKTAA